MKLEIDMPEHHYNNIIAFDSVSLGRVPYKGIIMYAINAIKRGKTLEQEPTTKNDLEVDAISRADVLKLMQDNWHTHNGDWAMQESMDDIRALPSVTPQEPRWIPVSERLPEVNQRVLVTSYGRVCYAMMISTNANSGHPVFKLQDSLNERVVCETTVHNEFTTSRIKAWMPLPEPYKEVRNKI